MRLQTNRLRFRQVSTDDLSGIHELHSLPETDEFNTLGIPKSIQETKKIINDWLVEQNAKTTEFIGFLFRLG